MRTIIQIYQCPRSLRSYTTRQIFHALHAITFDSNLKFFLIPSCCRLIDIHLAVTTSIGIDFDSHAISTDIADDSHGACTSNTHIQFILPYT